MIWHSVCRQLTNFDTAHLSLYRTTHSLPIVSNQVQFSLYDRRPLLKMIPYCQSLAAAASVASAASAASVPTSTSAAAPAASATAASTATASTAATPASAQPPVVLLAYGVLMGGLLSERFLGAPDPALNP